MHRAPLYFLLTAGLVCATSAAQPKPGKKMAPPTEVTGPSFRNLISFENDDLRVVLRVLAEQAQIRLGIDRRIGGTLTLRLENSTAREALGLVAASKGLVLDPMGKSFFVFAAGKSPRSVLPNSGIVRDPATAIRMAVCAWEATYEAARIEAEKPFVATLAKGVWTVTGTMAPGSRGGVGIAEISKSGGRILRVSHGR